MTENVPTREEVAALVTEVYAARFRFEYDAVLGGLAADATLTLVGAPGSTPFSGSHKGHEAIRAAMSDIDAKLEFKHWRIDAIIADLPNVAVRWHCDGVYKATGARIVVAVFDHIRFVEDKIVEITEFFDTASVGVATRTLTLSAI